MLAQLSEGESSLRGSQQVETMPRAWPDHRVVSGVAVTASSGDLTEQGLAKGEGV